MKLEDIQELWSSDSVIDDTELDAESIKIPEIRAGAPKNKRTSRRLCLA